MPPSRPHRATLGPMLVFSVVTAHSRCDPVRLPTKHGIGIGPQGTVCRCNESFCDAIDAVGVIPPKGFVAYATSLHNDTERLTRFEGLLEVRAAGHVISIDVSQRFQTMLGFGAAFTDASVLSYRALTPAARANLLRAYWGEGGLRYSVGRIPVGSTDFSTSVYSYNDEEWASPGREDLNLTHFSVEVDEHSGKLPLIRHVQALASETANTAVGGPSRAPVRNLSLFGSRWAPPPWMTTKNTTINAVLRGRPGGAIHGAYADYLIRFVSEYRRRGVDVWAITGGNEPGGNTGKWQDLRFTAAEQRDFIKRDLGPRLRQLQSHCSLMILDDQRARLPQWADTVLADVEAAQYVDGIGVHWYAATEELLPFWRRLSETHSRHPGVFILGTEASEGYLPWSGGVYPGSWLRGERYAQDVIEDVNNHAVGWTGGT